MRIAWFRDAEADAANPLDSTAALIDELRHAHDISVVIERSAHDFVWQHLQKPWDLCVFELDNTATHQFMWGYLPNYPGIALIHSIDVPHLRVAVLASKACVVSERGLAERLQARFPKATLRHAPAFAIAGGNARDDDAQSTRESDGDTPPPAPMKVAVFDSRGRGQLVDRAFSRARQSGARFEIVDSSTASDALARADLVVAPGWPPFHAASTPLLAAMAAGKAVITSETEATAAWSALDPQTWQPRGLVAEPPIAVTVDTRDEEHSLMLAVRRLSTDQALRQQLGRAARLWWQEHATPAHAAAAWNTILHEAATLSPPPRSDDWPQQFVLDGTELSRAILDEFGIISDISGPDFEPRTLERSNPEP